MIQSRCYIYDCILCTLGIGVLPYSFTLEESDTGFIVRLLTLCRPEG